MAVALGAVLGATVMVVVVVVLVVVAVVVLVVVVVVVVVVVLQCWHWWWWLHTQAHMHTPWHLLPLCYPTPTIKNTYTLHTTDGHPPTACAPRAGPPLPAATHAAYAATHANGRMGLMG